MRFNKSNARGYGRAGGLASAAKRRAAEFDKWRDELFARAKAEKISGLIEFAPNCFYEFENGENIAIILQDGES